ncbi:major strawberry allergen Fra a 1.07-like [Cornus florida]|uniref:major strawberry allergen Fra a 1.07-like n=1 Tax=Cornus florida TaxID=4283 RepID=UPI0028A0C26E|nr:major strawberry allergen Fra a 1.07-like [Cornus florida]
MLFKTLILDSHNLIPKLMPQAIKSIDITHGNGGAGSIKQINFAEGDASMDKQIESISDEVKLELSLNGGTVSKMTSKYYAKGDVELSEEFIKAGKEKAMGMYKVIESYLLQNPDAYA